MLSEHIGFTHWNDEECSYPTIMLTEPANRPRMIVTAGHGKRASQGGDWTRQKLILDELLDPKVSESFITVYSGSDKKLKFAVNGVSEFEYEIKDAAPDWLKIYVPGKELVLDENTNEVRLTLKLDREKLMALPLLSDGIASTTLTISTERTHVDVEVWAGVCEDKDFVPQLSEIQLSQEKPPYVRDFVVSNELGLTIEAKDFVLGNKDAAEEGEYRVLSDFGKYGSGIKAFPTTKYFTPGKDAPYAEYSFKVGKQSDPSQETGESFDLFGTLITAPGNPVVKGNPMAVGISVNGGEIVTISTLDPGYEGGERTSPQWASGVLTQDHKTEFKFTAKAGVNTIRIYAIDPGVVLERLLLRQRGTRWAEGYLGKVPAWIEG